MSRRAIRTRVLPWLLLGAALLAGCERVTHDMADQPRYGPATSSPQFADTQAARVPVAGTVPYAVDPDPAASAAMAAAPRPVDPAARLSRGQARYAIYCLPCHGAGGEGDGEVVRRGFPAPVPFSQLVARADDARLRRAILEGYGRMYPFADRVSGEDADAIVVYLRSLPSRTGAKP